MKLLDTIRNIFAIEELKTRIINTLGFIVIFRLGAYVVLPGVDPSKISSEVSGAMEFINTFLGGAFANKAIFALGIMPYISASIVLQLLTVAVPYFQRLQKEGESGRKKINQITRVLTIAICLVQSVGFLSTISADMLYNPESIAFFKVTSVIILTAGTVFCMWLGERITEKGIGNGISMLIMIGIISRFIPALLQEVTQDKGMSNLLMIVLEMLGLFFIIMAVVLITQATRRIPVNYAKQVINNKVYGGQRQYIPLKVNAAGVMPIIFAQSLMFIPGLIAGIWSAESGFASSIGATFGDSASWQYNLTFALLIVVFTYFYTAITIHPNQMADDLKRNGGFIPGIKPGASTAEFIDDVLSKITLPGALFIAGIAIMPAFAVKMGVGQTFSQFYGGTSLLIMVGVVLDTMQQVNSYLLMRQYEGMMKSGKLKGRSENVALA